MWKHIIAKIRQDVPKPLGRWSVDKSNENINIVNYYSNIDHCGTCNYEKQVIDHVIVTKKNNNYNKNGLNKQHYK